MDLLGPQGSRRSLQDGANRAHPPASASTQGHLGSLQALPLTREWTPLCLVVGETASGAMKNVSAVRSMYEATETEEVDAESAEEKLIF